MVVWFWNPILWIYFSKTWPRLCHDIYEVGTGPHMRDNPKEFKRQLCFNESGTQKENFIYKLESCICVCNYTLCSWWFVVEHPLSVRNHRLLPYISNIHSSWATLKRLTENWQNLFNSLFCCITSTSKQHISFFFFVKF